MLHKIDCRVVFTALVALTLVLSAPSSGLAAQDLYGVVFDNNEPTPTEKLVLIDPTNGSATNVGALITDCCLVSSGVSSIDLAGGIFYFVGSRQSDPSGDRRIFGVSLLTGMVVSEAVLPTENNYNFLEFDQDTGTLYAVVFENMAVIETEKLVTVNPATGAVTDVGVKITDCCGIPSGVSALDTSTDVFYFIGSRQSDPSGDRRIFTLDLTTGGILAEQVLPDTNNYNFLEVDPDSGTLYGVIFDNLPMTPTEKLVIIDPDTGSVTDAGVVITDCCGISSGVSALDPVNELFHFIGSRQSDPSGDRRIFTLNLADGSVADEEVLPTTNNYNFLELDFEVNLPPVAQCQDVTVAAGPGCQAAASIDDGSFDPEGGPLTLTQSPPGPYPLGDTLVTLTVEDDQSQQDSCQGTVTVVDETPPVVMCNTPATITPPDAPISFTATAADACGGATVEVTGFDCFFYNGAEKRIDKTNSCVVSFAGDTLTVHDSGGVDDHITWTVTAEDESGNSVEVECSLLVLKPGN